MLYSIDLQIQFVSSSENKDAVITRLFYSLFCDIFFLVWPIAAFKTYYFHL